MTDKQQTTVSSLIISEKRPQRTGGCVGIFFQIFDWNKRSAKKKLFSKKLLPPSRLKRLAKKFGSGDKLPVGKLLLIADENCGGFPKKPDTDSSTNSKQRGEMRTPNLVARLMGLESMPALRHDQSKTDEHSEFDCNNESTSSGNSEFSYYEPCRNPGKVRGQADARPQKLQRTGLFERNPVSKLGAEALQFKSALSRSRKQHQKLVSPVKSPRSFTGRNAARLMEAATKILEPSLQATNRAKCSLTYSAPSHPHSDGQAKAKETTVSTLNPLKGQASYRSCGNLLDIADLRSNIGEQVPDFTISCSESSDVSSHNSGRCRFTYPAYSSEKDGPGDSEKSDVSKILAVMLSPSVQAQDNVFRGSGHKIERKAPSYCKDREQCIRPQPGVQDLQCKVQDRLIKHQRGLATNTIRHDNQWRREMLSTNNVNTVPDVISHRQVMRGDAASNNLREPKDCIYLNREVIYPLRTRLRARTGENCKVNLESVVWDRKNEASSRLNPPIGKRRATMMSQKFGNACATNARLVRHRNAHSSASSGRGVPLASGSENRNGAKRDVRKRDKIVNDTCGKDVDVVSFMFNSPLRSDTRTSSEAPGKQNGSSGSPSDLLNEKKVKPDAKNGNSTYKKAMQQKGDALGALLEQKLRELASLEADELENSGGFQGKSTAAILEELISALTMRQSSIRDEVKSNLSDGSFCRNSDCSNWSSTPTGVSSTNKNCLGNVKEGVPSGFSLVTDCDNPSPTAILDASFSNESCFSESPDSGSGNNPESRLTGCSQLSARLPVIEADVSDSAMSLPLPKLGARSVASMVGNLMKILQVDPSEIGLRDHDVSHAWDVISDAKLLFENLNQCFAHGSRSSFIDSQLLDKLRGSTESLQVSSNKGFTVHEWNWHRRFLFDCLIEVLDSRYQCIWERRKVPLHLTRESLARQVNEHIMQCENLAEEFVDVVIEKDLGSAWNCRNFEEETLELGTQVEGAILQTLVDEILIDLW